MAICVEIEIDDAGNITVGVCPPGDDVSEPKEHMQSAENVEVALAKAKALLAHKPAMPAAPDAPVKGMKEAMFGPDKADKKKA